MIVLKSILAIIGVVTKRAVGGTAPPTLRDMLLCTFVVSMVGFIMLLGDRVRQRAKVV